MPRKDTYTLRDALLGGPGLDGYAFNADTYCVPCGQAIAREVFDKYAGGQVDWLTFTDSEQIPQPIFFAESDSAQHCGECGEYLYGGSEDA
jgi:hypothetical protein